MPTSDLQRLHQDEWLAALRSGKFVQSFGDIWPNANEGRNRPTPGDNRACAIGVGYLECNVEVDPWSNRPFEEHMGISDVFGERLVELKRPRGTHLR